MIALLTNVAVNLEYISDNGDQPIHLATRKSNIDIIKLLIDAKVYLEYKNMIGNKPICIAVQQGSSEITKLLIDVGADVDCNNFVGSTIETQNKIQNMLGSLKLRLVSSSDENVTDTYENNSSSDADCLWMEDLLLKSNKLIHFVVCKELPQIVKLLVNAKEDLECKDSNSNTPIHNAVDKNLLNIIKLLIDAKVDLECKDYR